MVNKLSMKLLTNFVILFFFIKFCAPDKIAPKFPSAKTEYGYFLHKNFIAEKNLHVEASKFSRGSLLGDGEVTVYNPGQPATQFSLNTLSGKYVFPNLKSNNSIIIHIFNTDSAFLECLWASDEALQPLLLAENINGTDFIFISKSAHYDEEFGALWMKERLETSLKRK